jgi:hypothetical protein
VISWVGGSALSVQQCVQLAGACAAHAVLFIMCLLIQELVPVLAHTVSVAPAGLLVR